MFAFFFFIILQRTKLMRTTKVSIFWKLVNKSHLNATYTKIYFSLSAHQRFLVYVWISLSLRFRCSLCLHCPECIFVVYVWILFHCEADQRLCTILVIQHIVPFKYAKVSLQKRTVTKENCHQNIISELVFFWWCSVFWAKTLSKISDWHMIQQLAAVDVPVAVAIHFIKSPAIFRSAKRSFQ